MTSKKSALKSALKVTVYTVLVVGLLAVVTAIAIEVVGVGGMGMLLSIATAIFIAVMAILLFLMPLFIALAYGEVKRIRKVLEERE